jgi:hypothetical protein
MVIRQNSHSPGLAVLPAQSTVQCRPRMRECMWVGHSEQYNLSTSYWRMGVSNSAFAVGAICPMLYSCPSCCHLHGFQDNVTRYVDAAWKRSRIPLERSNPTSPPHACSHLMCDLKPLRCISPKWPDAIWTEVSECKAPMHRGAA